MPQGAGDVTSAGRMPSPFHRDAQRGGSKDLQQVGGRVDLRPGEKTMNGELNELSE